MSTKEEIINNLSYAISRSRLQLQAEMEFPGGDADASDDKIARLKREVKELTRIRGELEDVFYGGTE